MSSKAPHHITKQDLEAKFRELEGGVQRKIYSQKQKLIAGAGVVAVGLLLVTYLLGRRKGRQKTTIVEIRRV